MAVLKKSSSRRFFRDGFLSNASLMLPRKRLGEESKINNRYSGPNSIEAYPLTTLHSLNPPSSQPLPADDAASSPHESDSTIVEVPLVNLGSLSEQHEALCVRYDL